MIAIDEAVKIIKEQVTFTENERLPLTKALLRVLAEDIFARESAPRFTNSAMDGFAVRWENLQTLPAKLSIIGESRAGLPFKGEVKSGKAVRISTGALLPDGADTVIPVEDTEEKDGEAIILKAYKKAANVRYEGEEIKAGDLLVPSRSRIYPEHLAVLASQGISEVKVFKAPRVVLLTTGAEIKRFDETPEYFQIRDSNSPTLAAAITLAGAELISTDRLPDDLNLTIDALNEAAQKADVLILSGGVSMGPHDHVKSAAEKAGFSPIFWKINQKPGKPFYFAKKDKTLLFGLPGNPVSAFMGFVHYIFPLLRFMEGDSFTRRKIKARVTKPFKNKGKRPNLLRVQLLKNNVEYPGIEPLEKQGSHMISSVSRADGYVILEPQKTLSEGEVVEVYLFPWRTNYGIC